LLIVVGILYDSLPHTAEDLIFPARIASKDPHRAKSDVPMPFWLNRYFGIFTMTNTNTSKHVDRHRTRVKRDRIGFQWLYNSSILFTLHPLPQCISHPPVYADSTVVPDKFCQSNSNTNLINIIRRNDTKLHLIRPRNLHKYACR